MQLLVVDGDRDLREMIADLIFDDGVRVAGAATVEEALAMLEGSRPEVVLCHLPILRAEGGRLTRTARQLLPPARIVAMSAVGLVASMMEADASLAKPFTRAQLLAALRSVR